MRWPVGKPDLRWSLAACGLLVAVGLWASAAGAARRPPLHWSAAMSVGHQGIDALSCPSTHLCVAGSAEGLLVSTDPMGGARAWSLVFTPPSSGQGGPQVTSVSCPSTVFCAAVTLAGDLITSTNPVGGATAWTLTHLHLPAGVSPPNAFQPKVACASASLCVAMSVGSRAVFSSENPAGGAGAWGQSQLKRPLQSVSCTPAHLCLLGDDRGDVVSSMDPSRGVRSWHSVHIVGIPGRAEDLTASACASASYCMMAAIFEGFSIEGDLLFASDPTGNPNLSPRAWRATVASAPNHLFVSGSCARGNFCAFLADDGTVYFPKRSFRGVTHTRVDHPPSDRQGGGSISCVSRHWCALGTLDGNVYIGIG